MKNNVVIDNSTILTLVHNPGIARQIPCLAGKAGLFRTGGGCGACAARRNKKKAAALQNIKSCLIALSVEKRDVLKKFLDAKTITIMTADANNNVTRVNF